MNYEFYIESPNHAVECIRSVLIENGWTILNNCTPDTSIWCDVTGLDFMPYGKNIVNIPSGLVDGIVFAAQKDEVIIILRSMNGLPVLPESYKVNSYGEKIINADLRYNGSNGLFTGFNASTNYTSNPDNILGTSGAYHPNPAWYGIVMTSCTYYEANTPSGKWYDQPNVIKNMDDLPLGVAVPIPNTNPELTIGTETKTHEWRKLKMIINYTEEPEISCVMTFMQGYLAKVKEGEYVDMDSYSQYDMQVKYQYAHMAFAYVDKVGRWNGGTILSGTFNNITMKRCIDVEFETAEGSMSNSENDTTITITQLGDVYGSAWKTPSDRYYYRENPMLINGKYKYFTSTKGYAMDKFTSLLYSLSSGAYNTTFCRVDIDAAPLRDHPVLWASATTDTKGHFYTGKVLCPSVVDNVNKPPEVPNVPTYQHIQSQSSSDYGRNSSTLNNISIDLPMTLFALRDPDGLKNYSQIGYVPNIYAISMRCVAPYKKYMFEYPEDYEHQVFPCGLRGGIHGYDGIAIWQEEEPLEE